jgi:hypothetical protein
MKGLIFIELLKMAELAFGEDQVDNILDSITLPSGASYTAVGYYDCSELIILVDAFSRLSDVSKPDLERQFGHWVMNAFKAGYPDFFDKHHNALDMLEAIENDIHVEVRKLYPDAELPSFKAIRSGDAALDLEYISKNPLVRFCQGLIEGCFEQYGQTGKIDMVDYSSNGRGHAQFYISNNEF